MPKDCCGSSTDSTPNACWMASLESILANSAPTMGNQNRQRDKLSGNDSNSISVDSADFMYPSSLTVLNLSPNSKRRIVSALFHMLKSESALSEDEVTFIHLAIMWGPEYVV